MKVIRLYLESEKTKEVSIILEQFNFEMQFLLDDFLDGHMTFAELVENYNMVGTERYDIVSLKELFVLAKLMGERVRLFAGVIPQPFADKASR